MLVRRNTMKYIKKFEELRIEDVGKVGGKNASLGQMISKLSKEGVSIPTGFAVTADAYWHFLKSNDLVEPIKKVMDTLTDPNDLRQLQKVGKEIRSLINAGTLPDDLKKEICEAYQQLSDHYKQKNIDVAVRSSATAEDLPTASFAGQQETFLNVSGDKALLESCKKCMASLFTDRAIIYRIEQGFNHFDVALSVGVQRMIRSDLGSAGVAFSLDTESGFRNAIMIESSWGLGESIVKGAVTPDEFVVFKTTLEKGFEPIIKKQLGDKKIKMVYSDSIDDPVHEVNVDKKDREKFSLSDDEIITLAKNVLVIEQHYSGVNNQWTPMDVEWAKDGRDGNIYIVQARPETIHSQKQHETVLRTYRLQNGDATQYAKQLITTGQSIGQQIVVGKARVIENVEDIHEVKEGDIIVTQMTDPDWVPAMKRSAGIITDRGGRTCHAAIVSRELGIPAIVGATQATTKIKNGQSITLDCSRGNTGFIYDGALPFELDEVALEKIPEVPVNVMVNLADPDSAFRVSHLPQKGVGLARLEFIIANEIKIHPMALLKPEKITDKKVLQEIATLTAPYKSKKDYFIDKLAESIGMIAAAFYPHPVIVRLSDFKSNEYRNLIGGTYFEPEEENPMIGFRGASRYYHERYAPAFALECAAFKKARETMGLNNIKVMIPFVRTIAEVQGVLDEMAKNNLVRGQNDLEVIMMCEIPSNVILIDKFCEFVDGFSIGSNDLTQLTLGVDRDSEILASMFDERDEAVKRMLRMAIEGAHKGNRYIGICGQAPSDFPELGKFLIDLGINSLSLNPDSVVPFLLRYGK